MNSMVVITLIIFYVDYFSYIYFGYLFHVSANTN